MRAFPAAVFGVCVLFSSVPASGQGVTPPPLTSNRPGIGDSEALVGRGVLQLELGVETAQSQSANEREWATAWAQSTLRIGVVNRIEAFVNWGGVPVDRDSTAGTTVIETGSNDVALGAKFALLDESRHGLSLTVAPSTSLPIGGDDFSSGSYDGSLRLMWARSLPMDWDINGNFLFLSTTDSSGRTWDNLVTTSVGRSLTPSFYAFGELAIGLAEPRAWTGDGGIAWVSRQNVQWDVSAGLLVRGPGESWFVSGGVTLRRLRGGCARARDRRLAIGGRTRAQRGRRLRATSEQTMADHDSHVTIHMAASLDGFIARRDGRVDWLETSDEFVGGDSMDPGFVEAFLETIDCYVMGSRTYQTALSFEAKGLGWSYGDTPTFVLTSRVLPRTRDTVEFYSGDLAQFEWASAAYVSYHLVCWRQWSLR